MYATGQVVSKFLIEPIHEQFEVVGEIAHSLIFYANQYSDPGQGRPEDMDEASRTLRQQSSLLLAKTHAIRCYGLWEVLRVVPKRSAVVEASKNLIGLSNSIHEGNPHHNLIRRERIEQSLNLRTCE